MRNAFRESFLRPRLHGTRFMWSRHRVRTVCGYSYSHQGPVYTVPDSHGHDNKLRRSSLLPAPTTFHIRSFHLILSHGDTFVC